MNTPRILILDDEKLIRWTLVQILAQDGYAVDAAASTDEAHRLCRAQSYELVLADLEVCGRTPSDFFLGLQRSRPGIRIAVMTAMAGDAAERELGAFRPFRFVEKPFAADQILDLVREALVTKGKAPA
jgi:DNA-binding NtrC family response regulator